METLTKRQVAEKVSAKMGLGRQSVQNVIDELFETVGEELGKGNEVNLTGYLKFSHGVSKAIKKGTPTRNPFSGETNPHPGKPAAVKIKVRVGSKLKAQAPSATGKVGKAIIAKKK